jgi:hypothetical protein
VLNGDRALASSRLQGLRVHEYLVDRGYDSTIAAQRIGALAPDLSWPILRLARNLMGARFDVVFFQKPTWMMFKISELLRTLGVRTVAVQCDPFPGPYAHYFDRVIVTSDALKEVLEVESASVIDDLLEVPAGMYKADYRNTGRPLRLVWVGQSESDFVRNFFEALSRHPHLSAPIDVVTIGRAAWMSHAWSMDTVYEQILDCDVAVLPLPEAQWNGTKSTNRLTQFMALGMPVIASPMRSYLQTGQAGRSFVVARTLGEFAQALTALGDPAERQRLGNAARHFAVARYRAEVIGPLWVKELEALSDSPASAQTSGPFTRALAWSLYALGRAPASSRWRSGRSRSVRHK